MQQVNWYTMYNNTVINCQGALPECTESIGVCTNYIDSIGNMLCNSPNTNCEEFEFDGGDCVDCLGNHFSEELCNERLGAGCTIGEAPYLGDDYCDEGDNDLGLNFNCEEWQYDGGDCNSNSRISENRITKKWRDKK